MITDSQIEQFDRDGAVTIDTPLADREVPAASKAFDRLLPFVEPEEGKSARYRVGATSTYFDQELLDVIQHPFLEEVAKKVLNADDITFFQSAIITCYPQPDTEFSFDQHTDIQYSTSQLDSVPKQMVCSYFLWISDVNEKRSPMMFRPGSHRLIAAEREKDPELKNARPGVEGVRLEKHPKLPFAEPVPVLAKAGQVSVLTTGAIHGGSTNVDTEPRKAFIITFHPSDVKIGLPDSQEESKKKYDLELKTKLRPERAHIVR